MTSNVLVYKVSQEKYIPDVTKTLLGLLVDSKIIILFSFSIQIDVLYCEIDGTSLSLTNQVWSTAFQVNTLI